MIDVTLFGAANKYEGFMAGIFYMQSGYSSGQSYWVSSKENAIWYSTAGFWFIGPSNYLGTTTVDLYVPIKDPSKECPHDSLESNWKYGTWGNGFVEDVSNFVRINCLKGTKSNQVILV